MALTEVPSPEPPCLPSIPASQREELQRPVMAAPPQSSSFLLAASSAQAPEHQLAPEPALLLVRYLPVTEAAVPGQVEHSS
jgi:hypothetical protein